MCFIGLTKAFDEVRLDDIIKSLIENNTPPNHQISNSLPILGGIRQGDSLSRSPFNILMDTIIDEVQKN